MDLVGFWWIGNSSFHGFEGYSGYSGFAGCLHWWHSTWGIQSVQLLVSPVPWDREWKDKVGRLCPVSPTCISNHIKVYQSCGLGSLVQVCSSRAFFIPPLLQHVAHHRNSVPHCRGGVHPRAVG
jgi:hypothetical protein